MFFLCVLPLLACTCRCPESEGSQPNRTESAIRCLCLRYTRTTLAIMRFRARQPYEASICDERIFAFGTLMNLPTARTPITHY
ncbi:hypothetical protein EDB19DRAFT_1016705 [Suillus lakei]|nr:hypothetical protein EDB19DRAFT_1016705 [Suillus lakei]